MIVPEPLVDVHRHIRGGDSSMGVYAETFTLVNSLLGDARTARRRARPPRSASKACLNLLQSP
jgi:hypothetical protein